MFYLVLLTADASEATDWLVVCVGSCKRIRVHRHEWTRITFPLPVHLGGTRIPLTMAGSIELNYLLGDVDLLVGAPVDVYVS